MAVDIITNLASSMGGSTGYLIALAISRGGGGGGWHLFLLLLSLLLLLLLFLLMMLINNLASI